DPAAARRGRAGAGAPAAAAPAARAPGTAGLCASHAGDPRGGAPAAGAAAAGGTAARVAVRVDLEEGVRAVQWRLVWRASTLALLGRTCPLLFHPRLRRLGHRSLRQHPPAIP